MTYPIHVSRELPEGDLVGEVALALRDSLSEIDEEPDSADFEAVFRKFATILIRRLEPAGIVLVRVTSKETH